MAFSSVAVRDICGTDPDPSLWLIDPDPASDHAIFVIDLQDANKNYFLLDIKYLRFCEHWLSLTPQKNFKKKQWKLRQNRGILPTKYSERSTIVH